MQGFGVGADLLGEIIAGAPAIPQKIGDAECRYDVERLRDLIAIDQAAEDDGRRLLTIVSSHLLFAVPENDHQSRPSSESAVSNGCRSIC